MKQLHAGQSIRNTAKITGKGVATVQRIKAVMPASCSVKRNPLGEFNPSSCPQRFSRACTRLNPVTEIGAPPADLALSNQPRALMKTKDAKKETKKKPAKTPQEKKLAKKEKKNSR